MVTSTEAIEKQWLLKAEALASVIEKHRDEGEAERRLPQPIYEALRDAGFYNMLLSRALGGHQADLVDSLLAYEELARLDGAVAWNVMIGSQGGLFADYLPEVAATKIYGTANALGAGNFGPSGTAVVVPGGYRLSGRWPFASGCSHANWLVCGCFIAEDGGRRMRDDGAPDIQIMFVPATEGKVLDTWHSGGLRGTGSHDIEVTDAFVPEDFRFAFSDLTSGPLLRPSTGFRQPFLTLAAVGMAAVALGIARDALESFKRLASDKTPTGGSSKLATQPVVHDRYAEAVALVDSARHYFYDACTQLAAVDRPEAQLAALVRLACAHTVRSCERGVEIVYGLGGGTAVYNSSRLDRCFRDVHTVSHHVAVAPSNFEGAGRYLLTGELAMRR